VLEIAVSREVVGVRPMILSMSVRFQACACDHFIAVRQWTGAHVRVALA